METIREISQDSYLAVSIICTVQARLNALEGLIQSCPKGYATIVLPHYSLPQKEAFFNCLNLDQLIV